MWTLLLAAVFLMNGWQLSRSGLFKSLPLERGERGMLSALLAFAIWIGANWLLAVSHLLVWQGLAAVGLTGFAISVPQWRLFIASLRHGIRLNRAAWFLAPVALWTLYALWRGTFMPPNNHDALAYHFPKAVLVMKAHTVACFPSPDYRIPYFPWNYELLLSNFLILNGSDRFTLWLSAGFFVVLLHMSWVLAKRWWGDGLPALACPLAVASAPVLLMHAGAHKNDLMFAVFTLQAIHWFARWWQEGDRRFLGLSGAATALSLGTKTTGFLLLALLVLACGLRIARAAPLKRAMGDVPKAVLAFSGMFLLLGGWGYVLNWWTTGRINGLILPPAQNGAMSFVFPEWHYSWMLPYMLLAAPFSSRADAVWVPWRHEWWFWPRWEIYSSHFGALFSVLICLGLIFLWAHRKEEALHKSWATLAIGMGTVAFMALVTGKPFGGFNAMPRFLMFILPIIAALTVPPMVVWMGPKIKGGGIALVAVLCFYSSWVMIDTAINDSFTPWNYVVDSFLGGGGQQIYFSPYRASGIFNALAEPKDSVAFFGDFEGWVYPLYEANLGREVYLMDPRMGDDKGYSVPPGTRWVVVDRSFQSIWGHPDFKTMGDFEKCFARWHPEADDLAPIRALLQNPAYEPVYVFIGRGQAIFRLRTSSVPHPTQQDR